MATISHRNYRPPTRRAGGPRSTLSPSISPPRSTAKTRIPRAKVKREGLVHLPPLGTRRVLLLSLSLSLPIPFLSPRPISVAIHAPSPSPDSTPRRGVETSGDEPVSTRGNEEREREGERRIVSRDRLLRGTTVSDSSIELVGLVALSAFPPPLTFAEPHSG